jgi:hypothetical protein
MRRVLMMIGAAALLAMANSTANAWVAGPGVGVGRPGVRGFGGVGGPGRVGLGVGRPGRPTPYRPFTGRVPVR